jgi:hypothetical protein
MKTAIRPIHCLATFFLAALLTVVNLASAVDIPENDPKWDWVKLDTGECLKGELRVMYDKELEFDSDHFGIITIDWSDVEEIRTARSQTIRLNNRTDVVGRIVMRDREIQVVNDEETQSIAKYRVVSIAAGEPKESNYWTVKASVGVNLRSGNVEQSDFNSRATVQRRTSKTRLYWDYTGNYSKSEDLEIANNHRSNAYFDYFFSKRFFIRPMNNIAHRQTYSVSLGYTLVDRDRLTVDITGGPSWQNVEYVDVAEGEELIQSSAGGIVTTVVDWEVTDKIDFIGTYRAQLASNSTGGLTSYADNTLEIEFTKNIDLNFSFIWERTRNPVANEQGEIPKQDDFRLIFGVGLDL